MDLLSAGLRPLPGGLSQTLTIGSLVSVFRKSTLLPKTDREAQFGCPLCANSRPAQVQRTEQVLLDHLIGDAEQRRRYCKAEYPCGLGSQIPAGPREVGDKTEP